MKLIDTPEWKYLIDRIDALSSRISELEMSMPNGIKAYPSELTLKHKDDRINDLILMLNQSADRHAKVCADNAKCYMELRNKLSELERENARLRRVYTIRRS